MQKLNIVMIIPGMQIYSDILEKESLGGSETAGLQAAKSLAKQGHNITIFANTVSHKEKNIFYMPINEANKFIASFPHDVCIVQRVPEYLSQFINSKINILWLHDLAFKDQRDKIKSVMWNVDKIFGVSKFHVEQIKREYELNDNAVFETANGIDPTLIPYSEYLNRDINKYVYCSRPERGLDNILMKYWPRILQKNKDAKLHIASYNINASPEMQPFYEQVNELAKQYSDSVIQLGNLSKQELYQLYLTARAYIYPAPSMINVGFEETSCITAIETKACGLPFVGVDNGAISETLGDHVDWIVKANNPYSDDTVNKVINNLFDSKPFPYVFEQRHSWEYITGKWCDLFYSILKKTKNYNILCSELIENSDIMTARYVADFYAHNMKYKIQEYDHINNAEKTKKLYEIDPAIEAETIESIENAKYSARAKHLMEFVDNLKPNSVLDYGCNCGAYTKMIAETLPESEIVGFDISHSAIKKAKQLIKTENKIQFTQIEPQGKYDLVLCQEVLEHVESPWELITKLESLCKPGGYIYVTVPYGPWELGTDIKQHLWEFTLNDFRKMLGDETTIYYENLPFSTSSINDKPKGNMIFIWQPNNRVATPLDHEERIAIKRPRQSISAIMLVGGKNSHKQLHLSLSSIHDYVEKIIVNVSNATDEAKNILNQYGKVFAFEGKNPLEYGFDEARNECLKYVDTDWILWIDSDEHVLNTKGIHKYLKGTYYNGYAIKQHHVAVDGEMPFDMPVRIFRNNRGTKFYGSIHEHPEDNLNEGIKESIVLSDIDILHTGYATEQIRRKRFERNLPLLQKDIQKNPDRLLQKHFVMRDTMLLVQYELENNGGIVNGEIVEKCKNVISIYEKYIKTTDKLKHVDSIVWYSKALDILGAGIAINGTLKMNESRIDLDYRFKDIDSFFDYLKSKIEGI